MTSRTIEQVEQELKMAEERLKRSQNPRPNVRKKQMNNLSTGVLVIFGIVAAIAAMCAIIMFAPIIVIGVFFVVKWAVFIGLFVGLIWVIGMLFNKARPKR